MKKSIKKLFVLGGSLLAVGALASCGGEKPIESTSKPTEEEKTEAPENATAKDYLFEAEYTDLTGVEGGGVSGSAGGVNMIVEYPEASEGLAVSFLHREGVTITYKIQASEAGKASMTLNLGNELTAMELNTKTYVIKVNGQAIKYNKFMLKANSSPMITTFNEYKVGNINLTKGENTIEFITGVNEYCNGGSGGPVFDYMKLNSELDLTWTPMEDNI